MENQEFKAELKDYIQNVLNKLPILPEANISYKNIRLAEFKTHYDNGNPFKHKDGTCYGIAVFDAITVKGRDNIGEFIKKADFTISGLIEFVNRQKLTKYVNGNVKVYVEWQDGDIGDAYMTFDEEKKIYKIKGFANHSASSRNTPVRERPVQINEKFEEMFNDVDTNEHKPFNDEFYNDQLDMDQQSPEFWDSL